jgi:lysophospholipase L1-like esterase
VVFLVVTTTFFAAAELAAVEYYERRISTALEFISQPMARKGDLHEGISRLWYVGERGRRNRPNSRVIVRNHFLSHRDIRIDINSLGCRDDALPAKAPNEYRILALGDSITFGDSVDHDEVFVEVMESALAARFPELKVRAVNCGIGAVGVYEEVAFLGEIGARVEPDLVLLGFYLNDSCPAWDYPANLQERGWLRRHSKLVDALYTQLTIETWLRTRAQGKFGWRGGVDDLDWRRNRQDFLAAMKRYRYDFGAAWEEESWAVVDREFGELARRAEHGGFRVLVAAFPVSFQLTTEFVEDAPQRAVERISRKHGFAFVDLLPLLRAPSGAPLLFDQCHPTVEGNQRVGGYLAAYLARSGELGPPEPASPAVSQTP